tara:strand:+ start:143 stop:880 length:738 start_codon:yes stop_codon:yes gene_type:complete
MSKSTIIITGCEGGIGKCLVRTFIKKDYHVIGIDKKGREDCKDYNKIKFDLSKVIQNKKKTHKFEQKMHSILKNKSAVALINNAAVQYTSELQKVTLSQLRTSLETNVIVPFYLSKFLLKKLSANNGSIINMGSIHSHLTKPNFLPYAVSKSALNGLTKSMAVEVGREINVIGIMPAAIRTKMLERGLKNYNINKLASYNPVNYISLPEELAEFISMFVSKDIKYLNGSIINFDGGISSKLNDPL